jgi:hypothetical protein
MFLRYYDYYRIVKSKNLNQWRAKKSMKAKIEPVTTTARAPATSRVKSRAGIH